MSRKWLTTFLFSFLLISAVAVSEALAQEGGLRDEQPPIPVSEIIQKFAAKEAQFRLARGNYVYRQDVKVQELDSRNRVLGEYHVISDILLRVAGPPDGKDRLCSPEHAQGHTDHPAGSRRHPLDSALRPDDR